MFSTSDFQQLFPEQGPYSGQGRITFESPDGELSGPTTIKLSPGGKVTIRLQIENYAIPPEYHGFLMPFLQGEIAQVNGRKTIYEQAGKQTIRDIDIMVPQGRFHGNRGLVGGSHSGMFNNEDAWIEIVPNNLELLVGENRDEEIWCLPLFGALSEFELCASACWIASREPYIHFLADGYDCGIQIFDTSEDSASGQPVAVAFGIIGNRPHATPDEIAGLLPWGLFAALEFTCGGDVSSPWIELRDPDRQLTRRIHLRFGGSDQSEDGFPAFSRFDSAGKDSGISQFFDCFFRLSLQERRTLSPAMSLTRRGSPGNATVDSCIADLVKALDALCKRHGLTRNNLLRNLDTSRATAVKDIVAEAREKLKGVRHQCKADGKLDQLGIIDRIISRQANVPNDETDFGISVTALLQKAGLHDAAAMNAYYSKLANDVTWEGLLSSIRGQVIHSGAIHISSRDELHTWFQFARHLHDICKRLILCEVGYKGTYNASNITFTGQYQLNRITPHTTVSQLGYSALPRLI